MTKQKDKISIFKPYLKSTVEYKGGKSKDEIAAGGKKVFKLSSNENYLGASPKALEAIRNNIDFLNEYPDRTDARLRQALANHYGNQLTENQFIATPSGSEMLELIIRAFIDPGHEVIVSNPAFLAYIMFAEKQGAVIRDIPLREGDYSLDTDAVLGAINDKTRILFLTSPNNPTGTYLPKKVLDEIIYKVPEHVIVVLDEVYYQFADAEDYCTALPYVLADKNVFGLNSFSKAYGLAGLRVGYSYTTPKLAAYVRQLTKPFMINTLSLMATIAALEDRDFLQQTVEMVHQGKAFLYPELDKSGIRYWKTQGNFILVHPDIPASEFSERMMDEGVMVRPVAGFGAPGCVRVTIGDQEANAAFIAALQKIRS